MSSWFESSWSAAPSGEVEPGAFLLFLFPFPSLTRTFSSNLAFLPLRSCWATVACSFLWERCLPEGKSHPEVLLPAPVRRRGAPRASSRPSPPASAAPGPCSCPPAPYSEGPRQPRDPAPPAVLCLRQLGTAEAPSLARPSFVDNKLGFHREAQSPPPPSRSPSPGLPSGWSRALSTSPSPLGISAEGPLFLHPAPYTAITSPFLDSAVSFLPACFFSSLPETLSSSPFLPT